MNNDKKELLSEFSFCNNRIGYDLSDLTKTLMTILDSGCTEFKCLFDCLGRIPENYYMCLNYYEDLNVGQNNDNDKSILDLLEKANRLYTYLIAQKSNCSQHSTCMLTNFSEKSAGVFEDTRNKIIDYIVAFYTLSQNLVFFPKNYNLQNISFRKSDFLCDLICPQRADSGEETENISYSLMDPFVCDSMLTIINSLEKFIAETQKHNCKNTLLHGLRKSLFCRLAERAFSRYIHINGKTHRISLNRQTSELLAMPYENVSSIEDVKPIRLFEKIKSHIENSVDEKASYYQLQICIIGHTEQSGINSSEHPPVDRELRDLALMVCDWFKHRYNNMSLILNIENIINVDDAVIKNANSMRQVVVENNEANNVSFHVNCTIKYVKYNNCFAFDTREITMIVDNNDMVFILDCPWLYMENYEIKRDSTLEAYCIEINKEDADTTLRDSYKECRLDDYKDPNKWRTPMKYMNAQYNRIMASSTQDAGEVCRIFNDVIINHIQKTVRNKNKETPSVVYVFSSEVDGLQYSYFSSHPLVRTEAYEGKTFSIFQFCNYALPILSYDGHREINFRINLWSTIKYNSIMFAYDELRKQIDDLFGNVRLEPEEYFTIYRNICVLLSVSKQTNWNIKINISFGKIIETIISKYVCKSSREELLSDLHKLVLGFVEDIYRQVIFPNQCTDISIDFGNDFIRTGFLMNLYSSANSVSGMYFWHKYRMACKTKNFVDFHVEISNKLYDEKKSIINTDYSSNGNYFMDKRLYDLVLQQMESRPYIGLELKAMFYSSCENGFYNNIPEKGLLRHSLESLNKVCANFDSVDDLLYKNIEEALNET